MATLNNTTVSGLLTVTGGATNNLSDITDWYRLYHCDGTNTNRLHVRTPIPADTTLLGWNPVILEVAGHHSYEAEKVHDFKALLNVNGYDNTWFGSQIVTNSGYDSSPFVYRSSSTYGGKTRVCFSVNKLPYCYAGYLWVRWWNGKSYVNDFAWAVSSSNTNDGVF